MKNSFPNATQKKIITHCKEYMCLKSLKTCVDTHYIEIKNTYRLSKRNSSKAVTLILLTKMQVAHLACRVSSSEGFKSLLFDKILDKLPVTCL